MVNDRLTRKAVKDIGKETIKLLVIVMLKWRPGFLYCFLSMAWNDCVDIERKLRASNYIRNIDSISISIVDIGDQVLLGTLVEDFSHSVLLGDGGNLKIVLSIGEVELLRAVVIDVHEGIQRYLAIIFDRNIDELLGLFVSLVNDVFDLFDLRMLGHFDFVFFRVRVDLGELLEADGDLLDDLLSQRLLERIITVFI